MEYIDNFISEEYEKELVSFLDSKNWRIGKRRMQTYGWRYMKGEELEKVEDIPEVFKPILDIIGNEYNQLTVNEYFPGIGIEPHYDHKERFGENIIGISLLSGCEMNFYKEKKIISSIYLKRRSFYNMMREWRYDYLHGIKGICTDVVDGKEIRRERRISLTFRMVKK